ncbi:translation initiation factor IF-2, mitochondrial isoform X2 [Thalassophryne amazonica]|uniref:translation initiation factor IF-2, mitochondrial isoform X2 n=1 Tax=Thalassophryne amazonica TaxID=390379 RepID=UPI0014716F98|nr:translation initiation factor IF-2, mitochondrial isoform X2 [Thalassophryne amazonica]
MMSSVMLRTMRLVRAELPLVFRFLSSSCICPAQCSRPLLVSKQHRNLSAKQVKGQQRHNVNPKKDKQKVEIRQSMTVAALAEAMNRDVDHVLEVLLHTPMDMDSLEADFVLEERWIKEVVMRSGMKATWAKLSETKEKENKDVQRRPPADPTQLLPRPPVVTIMGHVDHGKTTLLDSLRRSQIAASEAGGITQHIGAFLVQLPTGERITFLDTPGHAAFNTMRARGANATDIIILVVAADDGVMNQTIESIQHARKANVPIIVAVNKCDKPQADPERVKRELLAHNVNCEEFGGDVQAIHISALKGDNLEALAEATVALAEVLELKADPSGPVEAVVIESRTDKGKGAVTTALVQQGTLKKGCILVAGKTWAKVRFLSDERGCMKEAGPSTAVEVAGWKELPSAGEVIQEVESEQRAKEAVAWRLREEAEQKLREEQEVIDAKNQEHLKEYKKQQAEFSHLTWRQKKATLNRINRQVAANRPRERAARAELSLPLIIKGDVDGSVEAILNIVDTYDAQDECQMDVIHFGVGDVSENDISMAETFGGTSEDPFMVSTSLPVRPSSRWLPRKASL